MYSLTDIRLIDDLASVGEFLDVAIGTEDFELTEDLDSADLISLHSDRYYPNEAAYKGGWYGSELMGIADDDWGSLLWTLFNKPLTSETVTLFQQYAIDALKWQVDEGLIAKVDCKAWIVDGKLGYKIIKTALDGVLTVTSNLIKWV